MPAIEHITVQGFKSIKHLETLRLRPINVLIGANGSGKSNFIEVFAFLQAIRAERLQDYVSRIGGADRTLHFGAKVTARLEIRVGFRGDAGQEQSEYEIVLAPTDADGLYPSKETVSFWDKARSEPSTVSLMSRSGESPRTLFEIGPKQGMLPLGQNLEAGISDPSVSTPVQNVNDQLENCRIYHFHDTGSSSPIKRTVDLHDNQFLRPNGANLAAFLYRLRLKNRSEYAQIQGAVRLAAPFFEDFQLKPLVLNQDKIRLEWRHRGSDAYFDAASFSDGTLRFIALATLLLQPVSLRPAVILLDEPELGLHPYAITLLASLVKQASVETQIVLATQSPILLDHFDPDDVLVADRVNGETQFSQLDAERLAARLEDYSLGQLWEKNELGGRPAHE